MTRAYTYSLDWILRCRRRTANRNTTEPFPPCLCQARAVAGPEAKNATIHPASLRRPPPLADRTSFPRPDPVNSTLESPPTLNSEQKNGPFFLRLFADRIVVPICRRCRTRCIYLDPRGPGRQSILTRRLGCTIVGDEGKPDSGTETKLMRMGFGFKGDKLHFRGQSRSIVEKQFSYRVDATKSPKHLDITPDKPNQGETTLGIYALTGDELKVCLRYDRNQGGRPTEFSTKADSGLVLMVFKRAKATRGVTQELRIPTFRPMCKPVVCGSLP